MPLEHFKTQVLLLHSQQSTLDALSAGFGDRYAVHVATSGSEALNTLGETPIHVIVSAQELPGMSGLEALREAKKRSPDTIGILLAGDSRDDGLEALVSDQEVFQIVRGAITSEALTQLVDQATKRVRLLTLAESANDQAADVDEPAGEHIVMETSENGAAIISDGTARMRALNAQNVQVSSHVGGRDVDVMVLTKDEAFLTTIRESSRGLHNVHHANTMGHAEALAQKHKIGVLVTDAAMAGSDIEAIAGRLRGYAPRLVAIVAGRRDDGEMLMDLINRGHVYRFLLKPVSPGRARLAIEASVKHHLEAADSTFARKAPGQAAKPAGAASPSPAKAPAAKTPPEPPPPAKRRPEKPAAPVRREPRMEPAPAKPATVTGSPEAGARLDGAFGDSGRFRKTMSGLASAGKSLGRASGALSPGEKSAAAAGESASRGLAARLSATTLAAAGGGIALLALLGWWLVAPSAVETSVKAAKDTGLADSAEAPVAATPSVVEADIPAGETLRPQATAPEGQAPGAAAAGEPPSRALLEEARIARAAGEIIAPAGNNAIELYVAAREMAPEDTVIAGELATVVDDALALAEQALLEGRGRDAAAAIRMVRLAEPENARLVFLDAQVAQLELRGLLDQARAAIRQARFEDAASALAAAQGVVGADRTEIDLLTEELATVRSQQRVEEVLALAGERLAANALTAPANDNARYYYELALSNDADSAAARQGLAMVASKLVLRARESIDSGELDAAERALQDAAILDPDSSELGGSRQALQNARAAEAEALRQAEAERLQQAAAVSGSGSGLDDEAARPEPGVAMDTERPPRALAATFGETPRTASSGDTRSAARAPAPGNAADRTGGGNTSPAGDPEARGLRSDSGTAEFVGISTLQRTNYVAPRYPRIAQRRGITGWVDISFSVLPDGSVANIEIMNADPGKVFEDSAIEAVTDWRFEPPMEDGLPVEKRVAVRMMFDLQ